MGLFTRKKPQPAAVPNSPVTNDGAQQSPMQPAMTRSAASTPTEQKELIEDAVQYRVPPLSFQSPAEENYSSRNQTRRQAERYRGRSASPKSAKQCYRQDSYITTDYSEADLDHHRGGHNNGVRLRMRDHGKLSIRADRGQRITIRNNEYDSDDECCYRSGSFCRTCRRPDHCDCYSRQPSCHHQNRYHDKVEVHEEVFTCYDPNCRGGDSCRHWASETRPLSYPVDYERRALGHQQSVGHQQSIGLQSVGLQPVANPQLYMIAGTTPVVQSTTPYLVSNRPLPVTYGGVPVVVPAQGFQTQYLGQIRALPKTLK